MEISKEGKPKSKRGRKTKYPDLKCPECQKEFSRSKDISSHLLRVHVRPKKTFKCPQEDCDKKFLKAYELDIHLRFHNKLTGEVFRCDDCLAIVKNSKSNLLRHQKACEHGEQVKKFECGVCDRKFARKDALKGHVKAVHEGIRGNNICPICSIAYKSKSDLAKHHESNHCIVTKFKCPQCIESYFSGQKHLSRHAKTFHSEFAFDGFVKEKSYVVNRYG